MPDSERTLKEVRRDVKQRIERDLTSTLGISKIPKSKRRVNPDWYAMATLLLDGRFAGEGSTPLQRLIDSEGMKRGDYPAAASTLCALGKMFESFDFKSEIAGTPSDLVSVLADAAIGSPAVCALRTYFPNQGSTTVDLFLPFEFGYSFMTKMNTASSTVCIASCMEKGRRASAAHWKHVLAYCCEGNFQAMLDEYWNLMFDGKLLNTHRAIVGYKVGADKTPSLHKADSRVDVETYAQFHEVAFGRVSRSASSAIMRTNFAGGFFEASGVKGRGENKRTELRAAFNSPFRPFVLISTSIGQEGLDFHQYCRKIIHWNLPSNPIDFEQREGRINRYKGLAVRQTMADRYIDEVRGEKDVWKSLFEVAEERENEKADSEHGASGLLPYWGFASGGPRTPVERFVYNYPFSRDEELYRYLLETTARYRAVLGQPNQEELLELLERKFGDAGVFGENFKELFMNLCPFSQNGYTRKHEKETT